MSVSVRAASGFERGTNARQIAPWKVELADLLASARQMLEGRVTLPVGASPGGFLRNLD
jgi:hypothetical protein